MLSTEEKEKILFLWLDDNEFHCVESKKRGMNTAKVYKDFPSSLKALRRLQIILGVFSISPWLENWKRELYKYETVIIHASKITSPVVKYIKKKRPELRIIVWYWNPVEKCEKLKKYPESICERWSFDEADSARYGLYHNTQYYFMDKTSYCCKSDTDIFFLGADKGRLDELRKLERQCKNLNLKAHFHITKSGNSFDSSYSYKKRLSYEENLKKISKSKSILDVISKGQKGLTLRAMESLCFKKKLITNDNDIINRDFYHPDNVFILQKDCIEQLGSFLDKPFFEINENKVMYYDFENWLVRFINKKID